ncbi:DEAD/DEAH box helicase [Thermoleophilum album]|uniref:Superfamily II DNA or RNA helicase n=1 Tax=Thermoleophilum album TaxID=29539 RepID=A0A1H6FME8_THEAL|nr:DEAD/DEAH box helicase family protein [Thermoleophilum album]SEH11288.1 Superfamily II DNA or RNA helicase [Thermoleophilum album]
MAETPTLAATLPFSAADLERAERFARERFVHEGEDPQVVLAEGTARRMALDDALAEIAAGREYPSVRWRQDYSLLLGLERLLSQDEPKLADGTVLSAHQVDALSGTLVALTAELQSRRQLAERETTGSAPDGGDQGRLQPAIDDGGEAAPVAAASGDAGEGDEEFLEADEEPIDWDEEEASGEGARDEEDPGAARRFWFEHATGAGKTVAALGFVDASRTGGVLILTHRRNLVDQFLGELRDRGYGERIRPPRLQPDPDPPADGPVTVETYQWFVRNAGRISDAYTVVICDEAHTALGEKTSEAIRNWVGPVFIGMTATGALIARHVTDLFPTQTSRFDLAQAARRGVIAPLRAIRIPPGPGVRSIAKVPLRRGEVDQDFDQEELAALLDQQPFNFAIADLYKSRFRGMPGVIYAAGVKHAHHVAEALRAVGVRAVAVSGETPKRELARILASYERCEIDVLVNAQLLAEGWNSPKATVCMHLAPTASRRVYQQRVGRVTRKHPQKEAGIVVDFVHPATRNDDPVVTLHSLLDRDVYRGGAIVVGPVRRARGRRIRVEKRVVPVTADPERRAQVFERELWRIAVEHLPWGEQQAWAMLAGARVSQANWRRAKAMLHFDRTGELRRLFLINCLRRNRNTQLRLKALQEIGALRDPEAFDEAVEIVGSWSREERREGVRVLLQILADRPLGRREQAARWLWHLAEYSREVHEQYATQRWPEAKRLLGLLVNSSGTAHARNARKLVQAAQGQDRRLQAALLAAATAHTPEAQQTLDRARMQLARKPQAIARELLRNFPKGKRRRAQRKRRRGAGEQQTAPVAGSEAVSVESTNGGAEGEQSASENTGTSAVDVRPEDVVPGVGESPAGASQESANAKAGEGAAEAA